MLNLVKTQKSAIPETTRGQYHRFVDREVVVITPVGNFKDFAELGRYKNYEVASAIVTNLDIPEYKIFHLDTGEEVKVH
jgi:hypothetical protein